MEGFLKEYIEGNKFELLIDTNIFSKEIILKAAYNFLDKGYFFFKFDEKNNIILQFTPKVGILENPERIIGDFSDELLSVVLRDKLEKDNKDIREKIVGAAIANSLDANNFVNIDTDNIEGNNHQNQIDFDKDIDEILKEIENDPELKIDEAEIERILKEIEEETETEIELESETQITIDPKNVENAKKIFQNRG
ncbi:MAG: His-Xaa-Ser system protein HxsD [Candidatus Gracilibacteria bacterium]|nr:His-Xaa-Ser system protein HxsD [Candidatus Gracilibacteria bacterium]